MAAAPPAPPGGPRPARPAAPAGGSSQMFTSGTRRAMRVNILLYQGGRPLDEDLELKFGPDSNPIGHLLTDARTAAPYTVEVHGGLGELDGIDVSRNVDFKKVSVVLRDGKILSADIPASEAAGTVAAPDPTKVAAIVLGDAQQMTPNSADPRQFVVDVFAQDNTGRGMGNVILRWKFNDQRGELITDNRAGREGWAELPVQVTHHDVGLNHANLNLEVRSLTFGGVSASVPLPAPSHRQSTTKGFFKGLFGG